jgi:hypothetical protein
MKYIYYNNDDDECKHHFLACCNAIKDINDMRSDIIYNSSFPRLKQSKYRGIQAFKQLLKRHLTNNNNEKKFKFDEAIKIFWLKMYKFCYKNNASFININGNNTILCDDIENEKIKKILLIDDIDINDNEPKYINKKKDKNYIKIMAEMIKAEEFDKDDLIQLFMLLFAHEAH